MNYEEAVIDHCMVTEAVSFKGEPHAVISNLIQYHLELDRALNASAHPDVRGSSVSIRNAQVGNRNFDQLTVVVGGLHLKCDINQGADGDRVIRLAKRLADGYEIPLHWREDKLDMDQRVRRVTGLTHNTP